MRGEEALSYPLAEENEFDLQPVTPFTCRFTTPQKKVKALPIGASKEEMTGHVPYTGSIDKTGN